MLMHAPQFPPPVVPGAEYYRFRRDGTGHPVLATLSGRPPKDVKRNGATYEDVVKADRTGFSGIAACKGNGDIEGWEYPWDSAPHSAKTGPAESEPAPQALATVLADDWHQHRVVVFDGSFDTHIKDGDDYDTLTLGEVFDLPPANRDKLNAPAMIPSRYCRFDARKHEAQRQHGSYVALAGDIDTGNVPMEQVQAAVSEFVGDHVATLIYSSSGATEQGRKWRVIVPLEKPSPFDQWCAFQEAFFTFMEASGIVMDWALARGGQHVFLPNVTVDKRNFKGEPLFYRRCVTQGRGLTPADGAAPQALSEVRAARARDEAERQRARQAAKQAMQARGTTTKSDVIDAFNQAFSVESLLVANGYERGPRDSWRSPYQTSKTFATKNYGDYWVSLSGSDAGAGLGAEFAAGRFGNAFGLYCHFDHGGDFKKALREAAKMLGLDKQPATDTPVDVSGITGQGPGLRAASKLSIGAMADAQDPQAGPAHEGNTDVADTDLSGATPKQTVYDQSFVAEYLAKKAAAGAPDRDHPLSLRNQVKLSATPEAVKFVVNEFIQEGVVFIAGQQGVGKTSALLPLALAQSGLHQPGYQFAPKKPERWRHVIYITEDAAQVNRIIAAMVTQGWFTLEQAQERIHVIPAVAMDAELFVKVRDEYSSLYADASGVRLPPLTVADTRSACFTIESENDNAEMSALVAALKQNFNDLPIWVVAHLSKETATRTNASSLSVRGAGSAEGDAHQVLFLVNDEGTRWLVRGKTRFESPWKELSLTSFLVKVVAQDRWGDLVDILVRWAVAEAPEEDRAVAAEQAKEERDKTEQAELRDEVRDAVQQAWNLGHPLNREGVCTKVRKNRNKVKSATEALLTEGWLYEVVIPVKQRTNHNRKSFLVNLSTEQHEAYLSNGLLPGALLVIPQSWRKKAEVPSVPEEEASPSEKDHV